MISGAIPVVRGPCTTRGYYNAPEKNAEAITFHGFYRSGDLLNMQTVNGREYLFFGGRTKDVVDRGGETINCQEVEAVIGKHPSVGEVAGVAMPDPLYGEKLCVFIVWRQGAEPLDVAGLGAFLGEQGLAKFKYPERIESVETLPMTSSGKISKPLMREAIRKILEEEMA